MPLILIIFGALLFLTIIVMVVHAAVNKSHLSESCSTDADCEKGDSCIYNPDQKEKQCVSSNKFFCKIDPPSELTKCECTEVDEHGVCISPAKSLCDKCINQPEFKCVQVSAKYPYSWQQGDKKITIPNSPDGYGWCLPPVVKEVKCNPYISEEILMETNIPGEYEWGCYCKYPNLFGNDSPGQNCNFTYACGASVSGGGSESLGKLYVPTPEKKSCHEDNDCGDEKKCLDPYLPTPCGYNAGKPSKHIETADCKKTGTCVCHQEWLGDLTVTANPLEGQCVCDKLGSDQLDYQCVVRNPDYFEMNCVKGICDGFEVTKENCNSSQCYKQDPNDPQSPCMCCECPDGYIQCPDQITADNQGLILYCQERPTCIKDPCSTPEVPGGYWDGTQCQCGPGMTYIEDENSAVGQICIDPCAGNGPCGHRGTCYFPEDAKDAEDARCCNCVCPYTNENDNSCTCAGTAQNDSGSIKQGAGADCCNDDDCCSGDCEGQCETTCDPHGECEYIQGTCKGANVITSPCSAPNKKKCKPVAPHPPVTCDDASNCPYDTKCCYLPGGDDKYNCCPYSDGTCCGDGLHCCPSSHPKCDVKKQLCETDDGKRQIPWTGHTGKAVCCNSPAGTEYCCTDNQGTCCGDSGLHCCPSSHPKCDITNKQCTKTDGSDPIPWVKGNKVQG